MITAKNIKIKNDIISFDYEYDRDNNLKHIKYDNKEKKYIEFPESFTERDSNIIYQHMIVHILNDIKKEKDIPKEKEIMWY